MTLNCVVFKKNWSILANNLQIMVYFSKMKFDLYLNIWGVAASKSAGMVLEGLKSYFLVISVPFMRRVFPSVKGICYHLLAKSRP